MSLPRFYCDARLAPGECVALPEALAHHAVRVLRLRAGAALVLFDGAGGEYPATLEIEGKAAWAQLGAHVPREAELPGRITLVQGLPAGDKMDWVVEKAVELGAWRVSPIAAQRSVLQLNGARAEKRLAHWQRIAQAAAEQCGRNRLMAVDAPQALAAWLAQAPGAALRLRWRGTPRTTTSACWWDRKAAGRMRSWSRRARPACRRCASAPGCCAPKPRASP
ncbi:16S ribosomal RNA methyltransferase RsmE [Bordetella pertussis]|nr:16S ribosomal RNA methyltransferase RsmE [Bordetella pertussis]